jgi:folate-binding protein YgfZ
MFPMGQMTFTLLDDRALVRVGGEDAREFLNNIITNDVTRVSANRAIWAALLSPQGKYLHDFFVAAVNDTLMLDCEKARVGDLMERLQRYKLRSKVEIADVTGDWAVAALMGTDADAGALVGFEGQGGPFAGGICYVDPRYGGMGARALIPRGAVAELPAAGFEQAEPGILDHTRLCLGIPDGSRDLSIDKALPMENGFDGLNGIDWDKGCYVGQEMTARMRYRATVRRQLLPVAIEGAGPEPGTPIKLGEREAGEMRSSAQNIGLALLRIDALADLGGNRLTAAGATLTPLRPPWLAAPGEDESLGKNEGKPGDDPGA